MTAIRMGNPNVIQVRYFLDEVLPICNFQVLTIM